MHCSFRASFNIACCLMSLLAQSSADLQGCKLAALPPLLASSKLPHPQISLRRRTAAQLAKATTNKPVHPTSDRSESPQFQNRPSSPSHSQEHQQMPAWKAHQIWDHLQNPQSTPRTGHAGKPAELLWRWGIPQSHWSWSSAVTL